MSQKYDKLKTLLQELFQLDQPDLDFGLYRVMHAKSGEVLQFLDKDLLPQVQAAFGQYKTADKAEIEKQLASVVAGVEAGGMEAGQSPRVRELRERLATDAVDIGALESEVYDHLFGFFRRYYSEGDFLAKRVYKPGVYAIPYEGEEVTLHWANKDQYYIKTSEYLRDYAFRLRPDDDKKPMRVHFRLADAAEGEHGNVKAAEGKERVFILAEPGESGRDFIAEEDGEQGKELVIRFEYRPATLTDWPDDIRAGKSKPPAQKDLSAPAARRVLAVADASLAAWIAELGRPDPTEKEPDRTALQKHLKKYSDVNKFDYFIHKDLSTFLRRELDFYIKNEVMHLDDVENEAAQRVEQYLSKIKVIRKIAGKIINFLAQLEDFQKKLWLKKKFVVETQWCITLGCIPEAFYVEIAANEAQREEWVELFAIDEIKGDLTAPAYSQPLTTDFLKAQPTLVVDTRHFQGNARDRIVASIGDLGSTVTGCLVAGDNFHAARLARSAWSGKISCFYSDPPFNLGANADFAYKTDYADSTWLTLLDGRIGSAEQLLTTDALIFVRCDYHGSHLVRDLLQRRGYVFQAEILIDRSRNEAGSPNKMESTYEHLFMFGVSDAPLAKYTVERSLANIKWTGFLMAGDRNPPQRMFLGHTLHPPAGQHFSLRQEKVDKLLSEFFLRIKCRKCACLFYDADDDRALERQMKSKEHRFKFYDIKGSTVFHGLRTLSVCTECGSSDFRVDYLGSDEVFVNDNWLDIPSYSRRWGFVTENSEDLLDRVVAFTTGGVLDLFGGSGTSPAVAMKKGRAWLCAEAGSQAYEVILPRLKAVLRGEVGGVSKKNDWNGGGSFKYCTLESYEDALNNLETRRTDTQQLLLGDAQAQGADGLKEQYILRYMLDVETRGSQSLLNVQAFTDPTAYKLKVKRPGSDESREVNVDLLETFNWLIGLTVKHIAAPQTFSAAFERDSEERLRLKGRLKQEADGSYWFRTVTGTTPDGRRTLIIWRKLIGEPEQDNLVLDEWFTKQGYSAKDSEFDLIYVNGGNNLENLKIPDDLWKVRLIEEDFHRLMFEMEDS